MTLLYAALSLFSIPFVVLAVCGLFAWLHHRAETRRLARKLDECLDRTFTAYAAGARAASELEGTLSDIRGLPERVPPHEESAR